MSGKYPRFALKMYESESSKRTLFESDELEEVAEFAAEKAGEVDERDDVPASWYWHNR